MQFWTRIQIESEVTDSRWPSQGLFRVAPSASKLKKLKASLDCGVLDVQEYSADPHAIAGETPPSVSSEMLHLFSKGRFYKLPPSAY